MLHNHRNPTFMRCFCPTKTKTFRCATAISLLCHLHGCLLFRRIFGREKCVTKTLFVGTCAGSTLFCRASCTLLCHSKTNVSKFGTYAYQSRTLRPWRYGRRHVKLKLKSLPPADLPRLGLPFLSSPSSSDRQSLPPPFSFLP